MSAIAFFVRGEDYIVSFFGTRRARIVLVMKGACGSGMM
jgi:hypothetical protein